MQSCKHGEGYTAKCTLPIACPVILAGGKHRQVSFKWSLVFIIRSGGPRTAKRRCGSSRY
eukprot:1136721-Pelagomonas_calceolata.AAC.1